MDAVKKLLYKADTRRSNVPMYSMQDYKKKYLTTWKLTIFQVKDEQKSRLLALEMWLTQSLKPF